MAENGRNNCGGNLSTEAGGIPVGLNRIKVHLGGSSSKNDRSSFMSDGSPTTASGLGGSFRIPMIEHKSEREVQGHRKGKKFARWFTSYLTKGPNQILNNQVGYLEVKTLRKEGVGAGKYSNGNELTLEGLSKRKMPTGLKSFSHELGPRGGIRPPHPRAHSYNDMKELLGSLRSRFDAAKVAVDAELTTFAGDVEEILQHNDSSFPDGQKTAEDILILAQQCTEMTSTEFRAKCEGIVQDLSEKRQHCQGGLLKQLFTHMLFILTRCTRLLQFENESEPIVEDSLYKFKQCLESIPSVGASWGTHTDTKHQSPGLSTAYSLPERILCKSNLAKRKLTISEDKSLTQGPQIDLLLGRVGVTGFDSRSFTDSTERVFSSCHEDTVRCAQAGVCLPGKSLTKSCGDSLHENDRESDGLDSVICRICEELVPTTHLESHSYICAYADKCDLNSLDIDERLTNLAEILEQIVESCSLGYSASYDSPEIPRSQTANSAIGSEGQSPKVTEWHNKGVEGMFEDIHEMDTACIDDSHLGNLKVPWSIKFGHHGPPSSAGSMTSVSSTNTPRTSNIDLFWLDYNNSSEPEDVQQMTDLADIAHCIAMTDLVKDGASDYLLECMHDLEDLLQDSKHMALVIGTFGSRIESLLREKYALACGVMDNRSPRDVSKFKDGSGSSVDSASQSSTTSTPSHGIHKERTSIDDFEIIKPISRGAYGKVFLARKRATGDLFAIKVLKKLDMIRKNDIERILAERNILITVRNPFVVRFFYSFTCSDNLYLVMEYLNGGDLYSMLRKVGCLDEDVARTYIAELVLALEYLHSLGIVHRDLKPDNILIAHDGHIKLTDFGLSKIGLINSTVDLSESGTNSSTLIDADDLHSSFEQTAQTTDRSRRSAVGTPDYLAPEILLGTQHGYAADWWSVGVILFEFLTGIPPFNAESPQIIFANILNQKIPWPDVPSDMSYEARDLINRFLIHDPDKRLGANGASEVKAHPFFKGINWDTLALQKAAFVPSPDSADDTSYFTSRYSEISNGILEVHNSSDCVSDTTESSSSSELEMEEECGDLTDFESSPLELSLMNFSFKNLSQLASINYDLLIQSGKESWKGSSPGRQTMS